MTPAEVEEVVQIQKSEAVAALKAGWSAHIQGVVEVHDIAHGSLETVKVSLDSLVQLGLHDLTDGEGSSSGGGHGTRPGSARPRSYLRSLVHKCRRELQGSEGRSPSDTGTTELEASLKEMMGVIDGLLAITTTTATGLPEGTGAAAGPSPQEVDSIMALARATQVSVRTFVGTLPIHRNTAIIPVSDFCSLKILF